MKSKLTLLAATVIVVLSANFVNAPMSRADDVILKFWLGDINNTQPIEQLLKEFTQETGIKAEVIKAAQNTTDNLAQLQQLLATKSSDIDLIMFDVINPGLLAPHLVDLAPVVVEANVDTSMFYPRLFNNNIVDGKLVGLPWFTDAGLLYYRTDLLKKYGYAEPPKTWDELTQMAQTIQDGERQAGNTEFWGFVWQGDAYEGLTCDALEWQYSNDGGAIIEGDKTISVNNPQAVAALQRAAGWVGTISPKGVTTYKEDDARKVWQSGNAAFMRNWPYAYVLGQGGPDGTAETRIKDLFDVAPLPAGDSGTIAATLGGWQLGISTYSVHAPQAAQLLLYLVRADTEKRNAIELSWLPTIKAIYQDAEVVQQRPFMPKLIPVFENALPRPSTITGAKYTEVSTAYYSAVHDVLIGKSDVQSALDNLEIKLLDILGPDFTIGAPPTTPR
jgi:trehalose/maltose transport system substrate-binding protein